jgi:hypothetical protein
MHDDAISPEQRVALSALKPAADRGFYLAGGTGLCLRLAHRRSIDLDLFREQDFDPDDLLRELEASGIATSNARSRPSTLWLDVAGVKTSFMRFPYPSLSPPELVFAVPVAGLADIAAMKIEAIASRGARKDFYDLYFICRDELGLEKALDAFERRFAAARPDLAHRLKALTYFEDAEREPEPLLLRPASWADVRAYFEGAVRAVWNRGT